MKFYLLATIIILFGYFQYSNSLDTPCSYCKYCDFCDDCKQCPCTDKKIANIVAIAHIVNTALGVHGVLRAAL